MRKVKWVFWGYILFVALLVTGLAVAFDAAPPRDPRTFYATYGAAVRTLDPAEVNDTMGGDILAYVYEGLYNYRYGVEPYQLVPELAAALPEVSPDGLTMTVRLRPGIRYYDPDHAIWPDGVGPAVTAGDFVYAFKRVCDFNRASPNYSFVFQDHFAGVDGWWDYTQHTPRGQVDYDRPVEGFTAPDPLTLRLRFTHPYPQMIYNLVNAPTAPVCRAIVEHWGDQFRKHPVGTGAYALTENLRDQRLVFTANRAYRGRPDVDGTAVVAPADRLPHIARVQLDYFEEPMPVWLLFQQGLFDVGGIPKDGYNQAIRTDSGDLTPSMAAKGIVLRKSSDPSTAYIGINMSDPVLGKNRPLRQAMSMAFDRPTFIKNFENGRGTPAITPIPPGFPTYDARAVNPYTRFDVTAARKLMAEAERINGGPIPPLSLLMRGSDTTARQMAEYEAGQMAQIGVTLVPVYRDFARWQQMCDDRQTQLFDSGWSSDYPDEQDFLQLFYGKNAPAGGLNGAAYVNPAFDALYDRAAVMQDTPQRRDVYRQMQRMVDDDCPWILLDYPIQYSLSYDWVGNRHKMDYGHGFAQHVTLDQTLRADRLAGRHH